MAKEPEVPLLTEKPRCCPACGARVAFQATTCLMCGASLVEEESAHEEARRGLPGWASALLVIVLALAILAAGGFGLHTLLTAEPEHAPPTRAPTNTPTATPSPTPATPTHTPTIASTPTPLPPRVHQVEEDETLIVIAVANDTTVEAILALNPDVDPELLQVGQLLLIPAAAPGSTSTPGPGIPTATPGDFTIHVVASGETLISIADEYDIAVEDIRRANDLPPDDDTIRVNQSLVVPMGTLVPSPTPTIDLNGTPTPIPPYQPPSLLSPPDGAIFVGSDETILLQWTSVSILRDDEWYALTLVQPPGGVMSDTVYTRVTAWRVPFDLLPPTDVAVREFRWQVQVVREVRNGGGELVYEEAGNPSKVRAFTWLMPTPTPTSTPSPIPTSAP